MVKEICDHPTAGRLVLYVMKWGRGKIANQDMGALRWFPTEFFRDVTDSHIDWVCRFCPEHNYPGLVGGDGDR